MKVEQFLPYGVRSIHVVVEIEELERHLSVTQAY